MLAKVKMPLGKTEYVLDIICWFIPITCLGFQCAWPGPTSNKDASVLNNKYADVLTSEVQAL